MSNVEQVHALFRGSAEIGKKLRNVALVIELAAAGLAFSGIFLQGRGWDAWQPLVALALVALALVVRYAAGYVERFAEVCRRASAHAYAMGSDISVARHAGLRSDAPPLAKWFAARLPASAMGAYYEPGCPPGEARLREIYGNSAFHTWRLLKVWAWIIGLVGVSLLIMTFVVAYGLAMNPPAAETAAGILDALCSIVLAVLAFRAIEVALSAGSSVRTARRIVEKLITEPLPSGDALDALVRDYDFERTGCPPIPTSVYKWKRKGLAREWAECRKVLSCQTTRTPHAAPVPD